MLSGQQKRLPPDQTATDRIMRWGSDHPGITSVNPKLKRENYTLTIEGEVEKSVNLSWSDFLALPQSVSISDFHCVEGWSVLNCKWEGVCIRDIERIGKPRHVARAVSFESADNYLTSLFREELAVDDVLLACKLNGELLEEGLGAPVRLIVPSKYAYKSALWVVRLRFTRNKELGFWERRGYSDSADVWRNDRFNR